MGKRVTLLLMPGSFEQGFPVILRIKDGATDDAVQFTGRLPSAPHLLETFNKWQLAYNQMLTLHYRIKSKPGQVTNVSWQELGFELRKLGSQLAGCLNSWVNAGYAEWQIIRDGLQRNLDKNDEIEVLIETKDILLQQLPWHSWNLFAEHYTKAEVALSLPEYERPSLILPSTRKLRILAVLGNSTGINIQQDRLELERLRVWGAEPSFLVEPQRQVLDYQLRKQQWDILFFAGHSCSHVDGSTDQIYINQSDTLSIDELKYSLRTSVRNGLKLAIFNSCDGLGLARQLADLQIPQVIVMRKPVPDEVAQKFLECFLKVYAAGKPLYLAMREARENLQVLENHFPCASWLPLICQNRATKSLTFLDLRVTAPPPVKRRWQTVLLLSIAVTAAVIGVQQLGFLQPGTTGFRPTTAVETR